MGARHSAPNQEPASVSDVQRAESPDAPRLPNIPLPDVEPHSQPRTASVRGITKYFARRLGFSRPRPLPPTDSNVHPVLAGGLVYDSATNPGTFATLGGRALDATDLDRPATLTHHQRTAAVTFYGVGVTATTSSFIRCPAGRAFVAVRDVLDAVDAMLQGPEFVRQTGLVRVHVQSQSVADFRVSLSV
ncbi:hypothetical protein AURDEDRAFT_159667 [Auricularia subglabra TFB-10046 SS5]|nr:hypothetical protein AURDEDRAFT_159667 [Auricularia subglabra TFB-10046 SS5]